MARTPEQREELLKRANEVLEKKEKLAAEATAERKVIFDHLKSKYTLKSLAAAKKRLEKLAEEHEKLVDEGEEVLDELEESLEELDD
jgi:hypothetical protein